MAVELEFLSRIPYFAGLERPVLESIREFVFEKKAEKGEILAIEGTKSDVLYFVVTGVVKVFKTSADGKEQIFRIIRPGEPFNDVPFMSDGVVPVSAAAMVPVTLNAIKKQDLEKLVRQHPLVAMNVIRVLSHRVQELIAMVEDFSFRHVTGRVAKMLLEYSRIADKDRPRLTQQEMAAMIGTAREMVGRSLKSLEEEGKIRMERNRIVIADRKGLQELAGVSG